MENREMEVRRDRFATAAGITGGAILVGAIAFICLALAGGCGENIPIAHETDQGIYFRPEDKVGPSPGQPGTKTMPAVEQNARAISDWRLCGLNSMAASGCGVFSDAGELVNKWRRLHDYPCALDYAVARQAAQKHADYETWNYNTACLTTGHGETPGCPKFTGVRASQRVVAAGGWPVGASDAIMTEVMNESRGLETTEALICSHIHSAPFHRMAWLQREATAVGYGKSINDYYEPDFQSHVFVFGALQGTPIYDSYWPLPGMQNVWKDFDAHEEIPTPPTPAGGWPGGYPVTIRLAGGSVTGTAFCRVETNGSCTHLPHKVLLSSNFPGIVPPEYGTLYADYPLTSNRVYRVQFFGTRNNGDAVSPWWEFNTGAPSNCGDQSPWRCP